MTMAHILDEGVLSLSFRLERAIRTRRPSTNQREEGDLQREINHLEGSTHKWRRRKTPSRVTVINGAMSSTLMG
jgi:HAMP domain-containing protein